MDAEPQRRTLSTQRIILLLLITAGPLAGNACAQLRAVPITALDAVYDLEGYSVTAPPGKNWFELRRDKHNVYFGKRMESRTHSFIATAMSAPIAEKFETPGKFRDHISKMLPVRGDARHTVIESRVETDATLGRFCVRHYIKEEDRGAPYARGKALRVETFGVSCLHPDDPGLTISVSYTERGIPAETSAELRGEGENFVRSLKFTPHQP